MEPVAQVLAERRSLLYRPEIDGLRAIAVIGVIVFHLWRSVLPGGFLGVDVLFVISGFLITANILRERREERFSRCRFWVRRVRRIALAALLTVPVPVVVAEQVSNFETPRRLWQHKSAYSLKSNSAAVSKCRVVMFTSGSRFKDHMIRTPSLHALHQSH